jgi:ADP-ribose pyrophosphatase YjhB (NUDIX family)
LVVQENNGKFKGSGVWKFPTGVVDEVRPLLQCSLNSTVGIIFPGIEFFNSQGEDIWTAAMREVREETGVSDSKEL